MSARGGAAAAPLPSQQLAPPAPPVRVWQRKTHAGGGGGWWPGGGGGGGAVAPRPRRLLQMLALLLVASGYGLLLASSALVSVQQPPAPAQPQPQPAAPASAPRPPAHIDAMHLAQVVLVRPQLAGDEGGNMGADEGEGEAGVGVTQNPEAVEAELEERRALMLRVCAQKGLAAEGQANAWEFLVDARHHLVWCNVFKAASTAWLYNFNLLAGYKDSYLRRVTIPQLVLARARFPRPTPQQLRAALPNGLSFIVVREPFERLLSAYRNKLEGLRHRYYRKLAREIARRPRRRIVPPTPAADSPPAAAAPASPRGDNEVNGAQSLPQQPPVLPGPTFDQFVDYVIATGLKTDKPHFDEHWAPYYKFCTPCHVNFSVIAKVETMERDEEYIIRRAGLEKALMASVTSRRRDRPRKITNRARGSRATAQLMREYFSMLTAQQLRDLYAVYGTDFEMFGYNATKYYGFVRPDE